ncbi:IS630 family transposase [Pasteurella atlantica]|uniref:IS630 family transposase n=2 Tax=Pasteurellales TaxID=135625 RepID=UPI002AD55981|nr:IS630 family transposase [Pasteurella atlantica]
MPLNDWVLAIKKTLKHPKANEDARIKFQEKMNDFSKQGKTIIYLDESGFAKDMPRTHGYCRKGQRCYGHQDWHAKGRINVIGAIIGFTFLTVSLFEGNINSDTFYAWLKQDLLPKVKPDSVLVMDNATFHKRQDMITAIQDKGVILEFLPPYSPDLNPIEKKWAQAKSIRKKLRCDDINFLFQEYFNYVKL